MQDLRREHLARRPWRGAAHHKPLRRKFLATLNKIISRGFVQYGASPGAASRLSQFKRFDGRRVPGAFAGFAAGVASGVARILGGGGVVDMMAFSLPGSGSLNDIIEEASAQVFRSQCAARLPGGGRGLPRQLC